LKTYDIIVIGAGAAGLIAAGRASQCGAKVLLIEKMERAGRKLLITGKGRCNITNDAPISEFIKHIHPNGRFLKHAFSTFFSKEIISLINESGVNTVLERGGRYFPESNLSADVVNALVNWTKKQKVEIQYNSKVEKLHIQDNAITGIEVNSEGRNEIISAKKVIICTGGCSYPATGSSGDGYKLAQAIGHSLEPARPALVPLETEGNIAASLQGLSLKNVNAIVWVNGKKLTKEFGEMLFTHFGLSGPIILTISRVVVDELRKGSKVEVSIDLKPALDEQKLDQRLLRDLNENGKKQLENIFKLWLPHKMIPVFIDILKLNAEQLGHQVTAADRKKIRILLKDFRFKISGYRSFKEAIITAGGIPTTEIDGKTMESKIVKGLYFAGEVMDLDADTGGFNLQIAFSTGWVAGEAAAKSLI
jgi:predicted Rossmann fold flavoprotein